MGSALTQGTLWGAAAEDFAELVEPAGIPIYEAAFDEVGLAPGRRLLDVGCGAGLALQHADKRGAVVAGLDASEQLLAIARSRLPGADLRQGDIEELPYVDGCFDAVTAFNSVQYATDRTHALREIKRVARTGAPVAIATWGDPERCEARALIAAIGALLPAPPPGTEGPFALAAPGALESLVESARLSAQRAFEIPTPFLYPDLEAALRANLSVGPSRLAVEKMGADRITEVATDVLEGFTQPDGTIRINNVFRVVIAQA